mmetsp:Transcript_5442/g.12304  ORF Transcript_5442/g.12304 Transcript_5442/m.12304 type:complete len:861 (-) Transcript_5442:1144-3726(-)
MAQTKEQVAEEQRKLLLAAQMKEKEEKTAEVRKSLQLGIENAYTYVLSEGSLDGYEKVPLLSRKWVMPSISFLPFKPVRMQAGGDVEEEEAEITASFVEMRKSLEVANASLKALLVKPLHIVWSNVLHHPSLLMFVHSFLSECPRPAEGRPEWKEVERREKHADEVGVEAGVYKRVFALLLRLARVREGGLHFKREGYAKVVDESEIFVPTRIMEIAALYSDVYPQSVEDMFSRLSLSLPSMMGVEDTLEKALVTAFTYFDEKLFTSVREGVNLCHFLADTASTLFRCVRTLPLLRARLGEVESELYTTLRTLFEQRLPALRRYLDGKVQTGKGEVTPDEYERGLEKLRRVKVDILRSVYSYWVDDVITYVEGREGKKKGGKKTEMGEEEEEGKEKGRQRGTAARRRARGGGSNGARPSGECSTDEPCATVDERLHSIVTYSQHLLDASAQATSAYDDNIPKELQRMFDLAAALKQSRAVLEKEKADTTPLEYIIRLFEEMEATTTDKASLRTAGSAFFSSSSAGATPASSLPPAVPKKRLNTEEVMSAISSVKDILPDCGSDGFVAFILRHFQWDSEQALHALLEGNIPPSLSSIDRDASFEQFMLDEQYNGGIEEVNAMEDTSMIALLREREKAKEKGEKYEKEERERKEQLAAEGITSMHVGKREFSFEESPRMGKDDIKRKQLLERLRSFDEYQDEYDDSFDGYMRFGFQEGSDIDAVFKDEGRGESRAEKKKDEGRGEIRSEKKRMAEEQKAKERKEEMARKNLREVTDEDLFLTNAEEEEQVAERGEEEKGKGGESKRGRARAGNGQSGAGEGEKKEIQGQTIAAKRKGENKAKRANHNRKANAMKKQAKANAF